MNQHLFASKVTFIQAKRPSFLITLTLGMIVSLSANAADEQETSKFVPATLRGGPESLEARFFVPKTKKDSEVVIYCSAIIGVRGTVLEQLCNWDIGNKPYRIPAENAIKNARLNPASVNGRNVVAYIKYAYKIQHKDGQSSIKVFPNHFVNSSFYGDDYIAPQSYVIGTDSTATGGNFFGKRWIARRLPRKCLRFSRVFLKMKIDKEGQANDVEVLDKPRPKVCGKAIAEAAATGNYIPAFAKGVPVPAFYVEKYLAK